MIDTSRTRWGAVLAATVLTLAVASVGLLATPTEHHHHVGELPAHAPSGSRVSAPTSFPHAPGGPTRGGDAVAHVAGSEPQRVRGGHGELYRTGGVAGEPTLGIAGDGTIFYQLWDEASFGPVARSTDGGHSWETLRPALTSTTVPTNDPYLYVDPDTDRVFTAHFMLRTVTCHEIAYSDDLGQTWTSGGMCGEMDHQTLFTGRPVTSQTTGYPNIVYYCAATAPGATFSAATTCVKSLDGGLTFVPTGEPAFVGFDPESESGEFGIPGFCAGLSGHGTAGPDGTIYIPRAYCGQPYVAISRDEGATWQRVQVADNGTAVTDYGVGEHDAGIAVDREGNLYYTWIARDRLVYLATSTDGGTTWSAPLRIGAPDVVESSTAGAIAVGAPGRVAVAYLGSENSPGPPFDETDDCTAELVHCVEEGAETMGVPGDDPERYEDVTWNGYITTVINALGPRPIAFSGAVNDPGEPLITGACDPHHCKATYHFIDVEIGPDGSAWGAFVDGCADGDCGDLFGEGVLGRLVGVPSLLDADARS